MKNGTLILFLALVLNCSAQSKFEPAIQLLEPDLIAETTLDRDEFIEWIKLMQNELEPIMQNIEGEKNILITVLLQKEGPIVSVSAAPDLETKVRSNIANIFSSGKRPKVKFVDYSFLMMYTINGGVKDAKPEYKPNIGLPYDEKMNRFNELSLNKKAQDFESWMANKVVPMVADFELKVDEVFEGVINVGNLLFTREYQKNSISKFTENQDYWRALMEMEQWNQLILFSKMSALYAKGEYDRADRIFKMIGLFSEEGTLANVLFQEINDKRASMQNELYSLVHKGIALHDNGKYDEAIAHYKSLLKIFPRSAWVNYEIYYSMSAKQTDVDEQIKLWKNVYRKKVYDCDPLYSMDVHASTGEEAWLLYRRSETSKLFIKDADIKTDLIKYADIALDLEVYDIAAEVYWLLFSHLPKDDYPDRNLLAAYLYCLEKLDCGALKANFEGNFEKEFKKIEKERKQTMEESVWFKAMAK